MKHCKTCQHILGLNNRCHNCSRKIAPKTCYMRTLSGQYCGRKAGPFNMCDHHYGLLTNLQWGIS